MRFSGLGVKGRCPGAETFDMRLPGRWSDYFLAIVLMSLAWPLRGQFGHVKGALIPGAAAAVIAAMLGRGDSWKVLFPRAVILGAIGFSLGGQLSYGWLIERLMACRDASCLYLGLARLFVRGAIWGGMGMTFLGFAYSEKPFLRRDFFLLSGYLLFAYFFLDFLEQESFCLAVFSAGLLIFHVYNLIYKHSRIVGVFGLSGMIGFGLGFAGAVFVLYLGNKDFLKGPWEWWTLRDQILGCVGGIAIAWAVRNVSVRSIVPHKASLSLPETKAGFWAYAVLIPGLNTVYVIRHWILKHMASSWALYAVAAAFVFALFIAFLCFQAACEKDAPLENQHSFLLMSTFFFVWFLSALAISKSCIFSGFRHWEMAFTLFPVNALILSILLPFRQK